MKLGGDASPVAPPIGALFGLAAFRFVYYMFRFSTNNSRCNGMGC